MTSILRVSVGLAKFYPKEDIQMTTNKLLKLLTACVLVFLLSACGASREEEAPGIPQIYIPVETPSPPEPTPLPTPKPEPQWWICEELTTLYLEGLPLPPGFEFQYEHGREMRAEGSPRSPFGIALQVSGTYADFFFGHPSTIAPVLWEKDMVSHRVSIGEESIRFIADWLDIKPQRRLNVFFIHIEDQGGGGGYGNGNLTVFQDISDPPWAMAHEAVHALLSDAGIRNNFPTVSIPWPGFGYVTIPFFEEGLCIMLELLFEINTENERFALEAAGWRRGYRQTPGHHGNQQTRLDLEDVLQYVNHRAVENLTYYYNPEDAGRFGTQYTKLNTHHTAASFMFYLYTQRGSRQDLIRFYQDINLAENIFGTNMTGLITSCYSWLDDWR
jgi:hypothetical protein